MALITMTIQEFNNELASTSPAPGGGSVSALAGAMGAALVSMVCQLTLGKKKYAAVEEEMKTIYAQSETLRRQITELIDKDTDAFNKVMEAFGLPKHSDEEKAVRENAIENATQEATRVPLEVMSLCRELIHLSETVASKGNTNAISDAGVSALMIRSACRGAYYNVRINLSSLKDSAFIQEISSKASQILEETESTATRILEQIESAWR